MLSLAPDSLRRALRTLSGELSGLAPMALVVALLLGLLLPLPTAVVDLLLSLSLATAVLVVVASLRVRRASEFLGFPTLVLLATCLRLSLNVSTTRLILSQADAGRVVDAFAGLVIGGEMVVGAVMFAVITTIQLVVIARGSERVAEVAARFALDGMPGQQAAIDADLRSGAITAREAQARRFALIERSDYFARMDGVMRWVKGDAVVGVVIIAINLVGGAAIGSGRQGLSLLESLERYGRLAIGDGLLAQIPALLIALAASVLVARVDRQRPGPAARWLEPGMLLFPAAALGLLALAPGMPHLAFACTAATFVLAAAWLSASRSRRGEQPASEPVIEVRLQLSEAGRAPLIRGLAGLRRRCAQALGIRVPRLVPRTVDGDSGLAPDELELRYGERVLGRGRIAPSGPDPAARIDAQLLLAFRLLVARAETLVELEDLEAELDALRRQHPSLLRQALRSVELLDLLAIVRGFVRERIPAPPLLALMRALAEGRVFGQSSERAHWPEHAREALADHWVRDVCDASARLGRPRWLRASGDFEAAVLARSRQGPRGLELHLDGERREAMVRALLRRPPGDPRPVLVLASSAARPAFARLLEAAQPHVPVLTPGELAAAGLPAPPTVVVELPAGLEG